MPVLNWFFDDSNIQRAIYKLTDPLAGLLTSSASLALAGQFAVVAKGVSLLAEPLLDYYAQTQLNNRIGHGMTQMNDSLRIMAENSQTTANLQHQLKFHKHVHDYIAMRTQQLAQLGDGRDHHIFVYSYGTEWHPAFHALCKKEPLTNFFGMFDDLALLLTFLAVLRAKNLVRKTAVSHVLMPTTNLTYFPDTIDHLDSVSPIVFEGEKHSSTGKPYVHLQTVDSTPGMFFNVTNLDPALITANDPPDNTLNSPPSTAHTGGGRSQALPLVLLLVSLPEWLESLDLWVQFQ
jgi:hypothetical protein